jgi:cysteinyl-tRNA synthetase, unknown class
MQVQMLPYPKCDLRKSGFFCAFALCITVLSVALGGSVAAEDSQSAANGKVSAATQAKVHAERRRAAMGNISSWAIQLRWLDTAAVATSPYDMIVIDHAAHPNKDRETPFTPEQIAPMKLKSDGKRRIVLAYLSMGEAERYRYYWKPEWDIPQTRPAWLRLENPNWPGDYLVKFADPDWQSVIFGSPDSFLDRIVAAGFDGVYLDRVDAFQDEDVPAGSEDAMIGFVQRLADHARRMNPDFLIVMQNADTLVKTKSLVQRLDGISKEDLLYGHDNGENANPSSWIVEALGNLRRAKKAGLKVFVLEYAKAAEAVDATRTLAKREGFVLHITDRMLGVLAPVSAQQAAPPALPPR